MMQKWLTTNNWHWQLSPRMRWNMSAELQTCTKDHTNQNLDKENKLNKLTWTEFLCTSEEVTMHLVGSGGYWTEVIKFRQIGIEHHARYSRELTCWSCWVLTTSSPCGLIYKEKMTIFTKARPAYELWASCMALRARKVSSNFNGSSLNEFTSSNDRHVRVSTN